MSELEVMVTGVAIVMGVLALLWGLTSAVGAVVSGAGKIANRTRRNRAAGKGGEAEAGGIPPHHLVAIAAAVAEVVGAPHRIVRVTAPAHRQTDWTARSRGGHRSPGWPRRRAAGRDL